MCRTTFFQDNRGFTLIEAIIVVAIISILAFMAGPELFTIGPKAKIKAAVRDLKSNLELAKMEAIKRNCSVYVVFQPAKDCTTYNKDNGSYELIVDSNKDGNPDTNEPKIHLTSQRFGQKESTKYHFEAGTAICSVKNLSKSPPAEEKLPDNMIRFNGRGFSVDKGGNIQGMKITVSGDYTCEGKLPDGVTINGAGSVFIDDCDKKN